MQFQTEVTLWNGRYWWFAQGRGRLGHLSGRWVHLYDLDIGRRQASQEACGHKDAQRQYQFGTDHTEERSLAPMDQIQPSDREHQHQEPKLHGQSASISGAEQSR